MELLRLSYFLNTLLKSGITFAETAKSPKPRIGATIRKINAILPPITKAMVKAKMSISGHLIAILIIIMYAI